MSGNGVGSIGCSVEGCKKDPKRFGFCPEHFQHFKFGLVTKKGEKVQDYDKKLEHFQRLEERKSANKSA